MAGMFTDLDRANRKMHVVLRPVAEWQHLPPLVCNA